MMRQVLTAIREMSERRMLRLTAIVVLMAGWWLARVIWPEGLMDREIIRMTVGEFLRAGVAGIVALVATWVSILIGL